MKLLNVYRTADVARTVGIHPNTVRQYEEIGFISKPVRQANGYRVFTDLHIEQVKLVRKVLEVEILQNGLRKQMIIIIKTSAQQDFDKAIKLTREYIANVQKEYDNAKE